MSEEGTMRDKANMMKLIGSKWLNPLSNGVPITVLDIDEQGRLLCKGAYEIVSFRSVADMTRFGYFMVELAPLVQHPPPPPGSVERYIQTGEIHAPPVEKQAKCEPGCTPVAPCFAVKVCPAWAEEECEQSDWAEHHGEGLHYREANVWWYPGGNPWSPPELRCAREWGCGLVRAR